MVPAIALSSLQAFLKNSSKVRKGKTKGKVKEIGRASSNGLCKKDVPDHRSPFSQRLLRASFSSLAVDAKKVVDLDL